MKHPSARHVYDGSGSISRNPADIIVHREAELEREPSRLELAQQAIAEKYGEHNEDATCVYFMYSLDDDLLYIGISGSPRRRFADHAGEKFWITHVATVTYDWYDTREQAIEAEREAIEELSPRFNVVHNGHVAKADRLIADIAEDHSESPRCTDCGYRLVKYTGLGLCGACYVRQRRSA